jgi:hypothetical protein
MNNSLTTKSLLEPPPPQSDKSKGNYAPAARAAFVFLLVLVAGITIIGAVLKGNLGLWSSMIGGGLAISNYLAFMWIWKRLNAAGQDDSSRYVALLVMKLMMAGAVIILVMLVLKPHAILFLASYSALLPAMFLAVLLRG